MCASSTRRRRKRFATATSSMMMAVSALLLMKVTGTNAALGVGLSSAMTRTNFFGLGAGRAPVAPAVKTLAKPWLGGSLSRRRSRRRHRSPFVGGLPLAASKANAEAEAQIKAVREKGDQNDDGKQPVEKEHSSSSPSGRVDQEPCNVVFTHTNADFDSLAAAVALALLWRHMDSSIPTHVVLPRGAHPVAQRFLAFHKHLLPLRGFKTILAEDVRAIGVVDAQSVNRIGRGKAWLNNAESIHVFDHHEGEGETEGKGTGDAQGKGDAKGKAPADGPASSPATLVGMATELVIEKVGSTTTILVERLRSAGIVPAPHEATLFVLGIRADTGGLVYESTTIRDAAALLWCLENGASQTAISEFGVARVSREQRAVLNDALRQTTTRTVRGLRLSTVLVSPEDQYVAGLAQVCEELLELTDSDVFLLGATHRSGGGGGGGGKAQKKKAKKGRGGGGKGSPAKKPPAQWVSLIGRASPRAVGVDLNAVMRSLGGGGHPKAAAAALRCCETPPAAAEEKDMDDDDGAAAKAQVEVGEADAASLSVEERLPLANAGALSAESVLSTAIDLVESQIPEQLVASSFMVPSHRLVTMSSDDTVSEARRLFNEHNLKSAPVVDSVTGKFRGSLKLNDLVKANRAGRSDDKLRGMMRLGVETVLPDTPMAEVEGLLVDKGVGRLPVVDDDGRLVGIVTRTDVLRQHKLYDEDSLDPDVSRGEVKVIDSPR